VLLLLLCHAVLTAGTAALHSTAPPCNRCLADTCKLPAQQHPMCINMRVYQQLLRFFVAAALLDVLQAFTG
jgi:hypothetical protein